MTLIQDIPAEPVDARCLGADDTGHLLVEDRDLNPVSRLTTAVALAEWITTHVEAVEVGPGEYSLPEVDPNRHR